MTNIEKMFYIMELYNLKSKDVADKLEISEGLVSKWKSSNYKKIKRVYIYSFSKAYNIPIEIFRLKYKNEKNDFDTKEKIKEILFQKENSIKNICSKNQIIIDKLTSNNLYCYNFSSNTNLNIDFHINILKIKRDYTVINLNEQNEIIREGTIEINEFQSIIKLKSKQTSTYLYIIFDNNLIDNRQIFYGTFISKTKILHNTIVGISILNTTQLSTDIIEYILQNRQKSQIEIDDTTIKNRIIRVLKNSLKVEETPYEITNISKKLIGTWYFSIYKDSQEHRFEIFDNLHVKWYINNRFQENGLLKISTFQSIIEFTDSRDVKSYFIFDNDREDTLKICRFDSRMEKGNREVLGIGLLRKNRPLNKNILDKILISQEDSILDTFSFKNRLIDFELYDALNL